MVAHAFGDDYFDENDPCMPDLCEGVKLIYKCESGFEQEPANDAPMEVVCTGGKVQITNPIICEWDGEPHFLYCTRVRLVIRTQLEYSMTVFRTQSFEVTNVGVFSTF